MRRFLCLALALLIPPGAVAAEHHPDRPRASCAGPTLECATAATPVFAPDGGLWLAWVAGGMVSVARSGDLGRTFAPAVAVSPVIERIDAGPDARPQIVIDGSGRIVVAFAYFKDDNWNAQVLVATSVDGGATFAPPHPITDDPASQRFPTLVAGRAGDIFAAWTDKRTVAAARAQGLSPAGAALAFAWSKDGGASFTAARIARDSTCECCRLGVGFDSGDRPVILFRALFEGGVRDHGVVTFSDSANPGPVRRVSDDDWATNACPHQGPSLSIAASGTYHTAWFTQGRIRQGLFYARSTHGGERFSTPMALGTAARHPSRPAVLAVPGALWLAWKETDGQDTTIELMVSRDDGQTWSAPRAIARTAGASDHPLLVGDGHRAFLSWLTRADGYRLIPLEAAP